MASNSVPKNRAKTAPHKNVASKPLVEMNGLERLRCLLRGDEPDAEMWNLPARGGYGGGCKTGKAAAIAYLKYLTEARQSYGGPLQHIVIGMLAKNRTGDSHSLHGQIVGFFSTINDVLAKLHLSIDASHESLAKEIEEGLARTAADDDADRRAIRSQIAREAALEGWKRRRSAARRRRPGAARTARQ